MLEWLSNLFTAAVDWFTGLGAVKFIVGGFKAVVAAVKKWFSPGIARRKAEASKIEAEAEAEAAKIRAQTAAAVSKIEAQSIIETDEMLRSGDCLAEWQQRNKTSIFRKAEGMKPPGDKQNFRNMNKDWVADYLDKCQNYSDEEMQSLWAKILAGEADKPGSFSKSTVDAIAKLSKEDALLFAHFCQFVWTIDDDDGDGRPLIYSTDDDVYNVGRHIFEMVKHLDYLRLVSYSSGGYVNMFRASAVPLAYHGVNVHLDVLQEQSGERKGWHVVDVGRAKFTEAGEQLYRICEVQKNDAFFQYTVEEWMKLGYNPRSVWPKVDEKGRE